MPGAGEKKQIFERFPPERLFVIGLLTELVISGALVAFKTIINGNQFQSTCAGHIPRYFASQ